MEKNADGSKWEEEEMNTKMKVYGCTEAGHMCGIRWAYVDEEDRVRWWRQVILGTAERWKKKKKK